MRFLGVAKRAQRSQNNKFAIPLQYFQKEVSDKYNFLCEDKILSFLEVGTIIFTGHNWACPKYPQ